MERGEGMNTDVWTIEKGEGCDVDNGLYRERVDFVVDDVDKNARLWPAGVISAAAAAEGHANTER